MVAIVRAADGRLTELSLNNIPFSKVVLPDAPEDKETTRNGRSQNSRQESITDLAYVEGKLFQEGK